MTTDMKRRTFLKALAAIPMAVITREARATVNPALRAQYKYQDFPKDDMSCSTCLEFIPGKTEKDRGGCKVIPGDDEISPHGYCTKWNTM